MKQRFRLYRRKGGIYYLHDSQSGKQTSLGTSERSEAIELFSARILQRHRITLKELDEVKIQKFLNERWKKLARHAGDQITMDLLVQHLPESMPRRRNPQPTEARWNGSYQAGWSRKIPVSPSGHLRVGPAFPFRSSSSERSLDQSGRSCFSVDLRTSRA
jgi:hypothetical protein